MKAFIRQSMDVDPRGATGWKKDLSESRRAKSGQKQTPNLSRETTQVRGNGEIVCGDQSGSFRTFSI
jgi:hypothetical protein